MLSAIGMNKRSVYIVNDNFYIQQVPAVTIQLELEPSFQSRFEFDPMARERARVVLHIMEFQIVEALGVSLLFCASAWSTWCSTIFFFRRILA